MKPFFSVVIPTLNEEKYLPKLLSNLAEQTFDGFEVMVVDGQSEDKTSLVVQKFMRRFPLWQFIQGGRKNVSYQRNLGAQKAQGKYFIFFDADVNINPTCLEELHVACLKQKFSLATTWMEGDSSESVDQVVILLGNLGMELAKSVNNPFAGGYDIIVEKKTFFKLLGFREDLKLSEDQDLIKRAQKKEIELIILKEPKVTISLRRFRSEGTLNVLRKYAQIYIYGFLKGPITQELFDYPMGGHVHMERRKKRFNMVMVNKYIRKMQQLEKKFNKLVS